jgi:hypothetical protein
MAFAGSSEKVPAKGPGSGAAPGRDPVEGNGKGPEWPVQATDAIVRVVDTVRDKTTGPALNIVRWLVYGLVVVALSIPLAVMALIGVFRLSESFLLLLNEKFAWADFLHDPIGFVYLFYGLVFTLAALICWRKGKRPAPA